MNEKRRSNKIKYQINKERENNNISTGLTLPHVCACHKPGFGFLMPYVVVFIVFGSFRWPFSKKYFSYIVASRFIGGGNRRKPPTCRNSLKT
jgi:hypothetical protein